MTARELVAEALGTALLLATVVGSGIMAEQLAGGNVAIALLGNTIPTGAILVVLITILGPVSGAHFNPAVTFSLCLAGSASWRRLLPYIACQIGGAIIGVWLAHLMFDMPVIQLSTKLRWSTGQWIAEGTATFGLVLTILGGLAYNKAAVPMAVGLYITAAYWFTASTSFANPAAVFGRMFSDSFAGIAPASAPGFVASQLIGAAAGVLLHRALGAGVQSGGHPNVIEASGEEEGVR
jgi:glycerol uptake facilitator-like aquaporin